MKRFHVHVHVADLARSIGFYSTLFGAAPTREEGDYAKWMLEDPPLNFAISSRGAKPGIDHLGIQVDDAAELAALRQRAADADRTLLDEGHHLLLRAQREALGHRPLGVGSVQKRAVVIDDAIAIRPMCYLSLSFDHRIIDGATADRFMAKVKQHLQQSDWEKLL